MGRLSRLANKLDLQEYMTPAEGVTRWVVCAAIRFGDVIVTGPRHYSPTMLNQMRLFKPEVLEYMDAQAEEQGFIDQWGNFMTREEAMACVKASGQPFSIERNGGDAYLFSEGLY